VGQCFVLFCPASTHSHIALVGVPSEPDCSSPFYQSIKCLKAQRHCRVSVGPCTHVSGNQKGNERVPSTFRFRKFPGKPEGVWCSILATLEFPCVCLRAGLGQNLRRNRGNRQNAGYFPGIPGVFQVVPAKYPVFCRASRLILGPNQPQTRLRARDKQTISLSLSLSL